MSALSTYDIAYKSLSNGDHKLQFVVNQEFFDAMEDSLILGGDLVADLHIHKTEQMLQLHFDINGTIRAVCDVCLDEFNYPIEDVEGDMVVKFGDHSEELSEELYLLDEAEDIINVAQWIYEFVAVSLPIRMEHPLDEDGNSTCNPEMLAKVNEYMVDTNNAKDEESIDPRWAALKDLMDKN
ncbi:MAG: DUF177 domain-containing protein [Bacteroidia bacterium]|nr:DUF177 domain-containing protein [Bacteroidia bacterium]